MRIVIIEDEPQIREGLEKAIIKRTSHQVAGTASDGISGLKLIKAVHPDLIITDIRMPDINGLDMLHRLKQEGLNVHAVVLTGYAEFEYARTAINLEVMDYILKPVDVQKFIEMLKDLEKRLLKKQQEMVSVEQLILNMLVSSGIQKEQLSLQISKRLGIRDNILADLFLIRPHNLSKESYSGIIYLLKRKFAMMFIENCHIYSLPAEYGILAAIIDIDPNQDLKYIFSNYILGDIDEIADCLCSYIRLGRHQDLGSGIEELKGLFQYAFYLDENALLEQGFVNKIVYEDLVYPILLEHKAVDQIRNQDMEGLHDTCQRFVRQIIESSGRQEAKKEYTIKFIYGIYNTVLRYGVMHEMNSIQYYLKLLLDSQTKKELLKYFDKIIYSFSATGREQLETENLIILKVIAYIRGNYQNDIALADAAKQVGISPIYLSKLFAKEMNINFVAFLRDFRISAAKRMLVANKYKIREIAEKVGFKDPKYFNKVFKSVCGISPSEYKRGGEQL